MYDAHYGLSDRPFQLTPDPRFWFDTSTHRKAMAYLGYGLAQGEGFIVITGEIGAGKTTLTGHLMATLDREALHVVQLVSTQIEADDLLRLVAGGLEIDPAGLSKAALLQAIERGLQAVARTGRRTLLIVDEAQALPVSALEELRMLSNFTLGGYALLQIFLLGQPEFRQRLNGSDRLEQLRQRVIATHHLDPMGADEVAGYVSHRLAVAGWTGNPIFTPAAFAELHAATGGVPRRLNQLAGRVLLFGAMEGLQEIDDHHVGTVVADLTGEAATPRAAPATILPEPEPGSEPDLAPEPDLEPEPEQEREQEVTMRLVPDPVPPTAPVADHDDAEPTARPRWTPLVDETVRPLHLVPPVAPMAASVDDADVDPRPLLDRPTALEAGLDVDHRLAERVAALEARLEEQDVALRRVLTLMVDWVESDRRPDLSDLRPSAA